MVIATLAISFFISYRPSLVSFGKISLTSIFSFSTIARKTNSQGSLLGSVKQTRWRPNNSFFGRTKLKPVRLPRYISFGLSGFVKVYWRSTRWINQFGNPIRRLNHLGTFNESDQLYQRPDKFVLEGLSWRLSRLTARLFEIQPVLLLSRVGEL